MIQTGFDLARGVLFEKSLGQSAFHTQPNRGDSLYSEICPSTRLRVVSLSNHFGIEFCNLGFIWYLGFEIWNLTNFILETRIRLDQHEFCKLHAGRNYMLCPMRLALGAEAWILFADGYNSMSGDKFDLETSSCRFSSTIVKNAIKILNVWSSDLIKRNAPHAAAKRWPNWCLPAGLSVRAVVEKPCPRQQDHRVAVVLQAVAPGAVPDETCA